MSTFLALYSLRALHCHAFPARPLPGQTRPNEDCQYVQAGDPAAPSWEVKSNPGFFGCGECSKPFLVFLVELMPAHPAPAPPIPWLKCLMGC